MSKNLSSHYQGLRQLGLSMYGTDCSEYSIVSDFVALHKPQSPSLPGGSYTYNTLQCYDPVEKRKFSKSVTPIFSRAADEQVTTQGTSSNGRAVIFEMQRWNNMLLEGERGYCMSDKPFDLVSGWVIDQQTSELVFDQAMFIAVWGAKRGERTTDQIRQGYRSRYDIEPNNRFNKQQLLLDKYQTPLVEHLDAWVFVVCLTNWLLYAASDEVELAYPKWQKYLPQVKDAQHKHQRKTIAQTRKAAKVLFRTFDLTPFAPKKSKNGKGRKVGQKQVK